MDFRSLDLQSLYQAGSITKAELNLAQTIANEQTSQLNLVQGIANKQTSQALLLNLPKYNEDHPLNTEATAMMHQIFDALEPMNAKEKLEYLDGMHERGLLNTTQQEMIRQLILVDVVVGVFKNNNQFIEIAETMTEFPPIDPLQRFDWNYLLELDQNYSISFYIFSSKQRSKGTKSIPSQLLVNVNIIFAVIFFIMLILPNLLSFDLIMTMNQLTKGVFLMIMLLPGLVFIYSAYYTYNLMKKYEQFKQIYQEQRIELVKKQHWGERYGYQSTGTPRRSIP